MSADIIIILVILGFMEAIAIIGLMSGIMEYKEKISNMVQSAYNEWIEDCKHHDEILLWVNTLEERFNNLIVMDEYQTIKPYDIFPLTSPMPFITSIFSCGIAMDKFHKLRLVPNIPSYKDTDDKDIYLSYCYVYGENLDKFIKECGDKALEYKLREEKKERISKTINK